MLVSVAHVYACMCISREHMRVYVFACVRVCMCGLGAEGMTYQQLNQSCPFIPSKHRVS